MEQTLWRSVASRIGRFAGCDEWQGRKSLGGRVYATCVRDKTLGTVSGVWS